MRIIFILIFILIFLSKASWSFADYKYLICEINTPTNESIFINRRCSFFTINKGEYEEEIITIDKSNKKIDIFKDKYKSGFYIFSENSMSLKESLFFLKIKLNRKLHRKSLILTTIDNNRFISNHNCSINVLADYQKKKFDNITKLKENMDYQL